MDWQPIDTRSEIPTDQYGVTDRVLLLLSGPDGPMVVLAYWDPYYDKGGGGYSGGSAWVLDGGETIDLHWVAEPSHWMPLPPPPGTEA